MNWQQIDRHLAECTKQPGISVLPNNLDVGDYREFLERYNGLEGFITPDQYLMLWSAEQIDELNAGYQVAEFAPGIILIGTDGGGIGYGCDSSTGRFGSVPLVGMSKSEFKELGKSFEEFLAKISGA